MIIGYFCKISLLQLTWQSQLIQIGMTHKHVNSRIVIGGLQHQMFVHHQQVDHLLLVGIMIIGVPKL
jgi:hypothetical protein